MDSNTPSTSSTLWKAYGFFVVVVAVAFITVACDALGPTVEDSEEPSSTITQPPAIPRSGEEVLPIDPAIQQTSLWCWAAVSEMTLRHYGFGTINPGGDYQCGVVALLGGICNLDCYACETGIQNIRNLVVVLRRYQRIATDFGVGGREFVPRSSARLTPRGIVHEIDRGRPVMAVINTSRAGVVYPSGFGEHISLIVGYKIIDGVFSVVVNDPFPYLLTGRTPFLNAGAELRRPGQYLINFESFVSQLNYSYSISFS